MERVCLLSFIEWSENCWMFLPVQLEEGHGSIGRQEDVHGVRLHSSAVAFHGCLVLPFFEVSVSLNSKRLRWVSEQTDREERR